jgi:hypothetical protein
MLQSSAKGVTLRLRTFPEMADFGAKEAKTTPQVPDASLLFGYSMRWEIKFLTILIWASVAASLPLFILLLLSFFLSELAPPLFWACLLVGVLGVLMSASTAFLKLRRHEQALAR